MSIELKNLIEKLNAEWADFKSENDRRLKEMSAKGGKSDPLTEEKVDKHSAAIGALQAQLDEFQKKAQRPGAVGEIDADMKKAAHRKGFNAFLRKGVDAGLADLQLQAVMSVGVDTEGGYLVPETIDSAVEHHLLEHSPMREVCRVIKATNESYTKIVSLGGLASGWVGEKEARPETATPTFSEMKPYFGEIYANPGVTQKLLDDVGFDLEAWLAEEIALEFSAQENLAFTSGNGIKKPKGVLNSTLSTLGDNARAFGEIQKVASGSSGAFVADRMIDLVTSLRPQYRNNSTLMINSLAVGAIRKLKDGVSGQYLFQPSFLAGEPATVLGYKIVENQDMPDPAADAKVAIFGDFNRGYTIVDVRGIRILRDPYTDKPKVHFYATKRVGGFVSDANALKVLVLT